MLRKKDMPGQWNEGRHTFTDSVLDVCIRFEVRRGIVTQMFIDRHNMCRDRMVCIDFTNNLGFLCDKNLPLYRQRVGSA